MKESVVFIGLKRFEDANEFKDYADDMMHDFLDNIEQLDGYTYPANGQSIYEQENGINFYYTKRGKELVNNWIRRMNLVFEKYFPNDYGFEPTCCYWRVF